MDNDEMNIGYLIMTEVNGYRNIAPRPYVYESKAQANFALKEALESKHYDTAYLVMVQIWKR